MSFFYENQGTNKYLVYEIEENEEVDSLSLCMLSSNKIDGVVPLFYTQADTRRLFKYNISSKISLDKFFSDTINKKQMLKVLRSIVSALLIAGEYMIDNNSMILNEEYIFVDASEGSAWMICCPITRSEADKDNIKNFFKKIVFLAQYDQSENSDYIAELITYLNGKQGFLLNEFKGLLERLMNKAANSLSVKISNDNRYIVTEIENNKKGNYLSKTVFNTDAAYVNDNSIEDRLQNSDKTVNLQQEKRMSIGYLITHYNKENRLKYIEQHRKHQNTSVENFSVLEQQEHNFALNSCLLSTVRGTVETENRDFKFRLM